MTVTRQDRGPEQSAETYTVSAPFNGTLTRRALVDGDLTDIQGIAVETWINKHYDLFRVGGFWKSCANGWVNWFDPNNPQCMDFDPNVGAKDFAEFTDFGSLTVGENDRKSVNIGRWDQSANGGNGAPLNYKYLTADPDVGGVTFTTAGFYQVQQDQSTNFQPVLMPGGVYIPANGDNLWIDIGGSIYVQYVGDYDGPVTTTGWVQKQLESFDEQTWTPSFDPSGDSEFTPEPGRDYYINNRGANFIVKRTDAETPVTAGKYDVMVELQTAANPVNYSEILPAGTAYLRAPWRPEVRYVLNTTAGSANFLKLVYTVDDPNTQGVDEGEVETVLSNGEWGLRAYTDNGTAGDLTDDAPLMADGTSVSVNEWGMSADPDLRPVEFNWEYSTDDNGWGVQRYLLDGEGDYVLLSDPIQLQPIQVANGAGETKTVALQYDGWMHGLPDLYYELSKSNWQMSDEISDKVINIPAGTAVTDVTDDAISYYVKPLEIGVFLAEVPGSTPGVPDISDADAVDLDDVPDYVAHGMGDMPDSEVKYSEGKPVDDAV